MLIQQFVSTLSTLCTTRNAMLIRAKIFLHSHKLTKTGRRHSSCRALKLRFQEVSPLNPYVGSHPRYKHPRGGERGGGVLRGQPRALYARHS